MVSKYEADGRIVVDGLEVDVLATLQMLEGRLDEAKRQRALELFETVGKSHTPSPAGAGVERPKSAKVEREEIERDLKALQLGRESGELVAVEDVEAAARAAIAAMRKTFNNARRDAASRICATFGIPADRQAALARFLGQEFETAMGAFAREMDAAGEAAQASVGAYAAPERYAEGAALI
jgi:hypothetical protein